MRLQTKGFKIQAGTIPLQKLNLIVGPNASGKTAILQGIRFAALGYDPGLGKRNADTARLMRGSELRVGLELDDGRTIVRGLTRKGKALTADHKASWIGADVPEEHDLAIIKAFGLNALDVAEAFHIKALLDVTPSKRAARILEIIGEGGGSHVEKAKAIARLTYLRLLKREAGDECPEDYRKLRDLIDQGQRPILDAIGDPLLDCLKVGGIVDALTWANEEKRANAKGVKEANAGKEAIETRLATLPGFLEETKIRALEDERAHLQQAQGADTERDAERARKRQELCTALEELVKAEAALRASTENRAKIGAEGSELNEKRDSLDGVNAELDGLEPPIPGDATKIRDLKNASVDLHRQAQEVSIPEALDPEPLKEALKKAQDDLRELAASPWSDVERGSQEIIKAAKASNTTKLSKVVLPIAERLHATAEKSLGGNLDKLKERVSEATEKLQITLDSIPMVESEIQAAGDKMEALVTEGKRKDAEAKALEDGQGGEFNALLEIFKKKKEALQAMRDTLTEWLARAEKERATAKEDYDQKARARDSLGSRISRLEEALSELPEREPGSDASEDSPRLEEIATTLKANLKVQANHDELKAMVSQLEAATAKRDVYAALEWALKKRREEEINRSSGLSEGIQKFLTGAGRQEVPFIQPKKGSCEIGWRTPEKDEVSVETMSGAEWVLFTTALSYAIMVARKAPICLLLVDAGEVDAEALPLLLRGIQSVQGDLTAAIVLTWFDMEKYSAGSAPAGWTVTRIPGNGGS